MNAGTPGQKSKLVESFLLLLSLLSPSTSPSASPAQGVARICVRLRCRAGRAAVRGRGGARSGGRGGEGDRRFPSGENTYVKTKGNTTTRPFTQPACAGKCPRLWRSKVRGESWGGGVGELGYLLPPPPHPMPPPEALREGNKGFASRPPARRQRMGSGHAPGAAGSVPAASRDPPASPRGCSQVRRGGLVSATDGPIYSKCCPSTLSSRSKTLRGAGWWLLLILSPPQGTLAGQSKPLFYLQLIWALNTCCHSLKAQLLSQISYHIGKQTRKHKS